MSVNPCKYTEFTIHIQMFREGFTPPHENNQNGAVLGSGSDKFKIARIDVGCGDGEKTGEVDHYPA